MKILTQKIIILFLFIFTIIVSACTVNNNNNPNNNIFPDLSLINANPDYDASYFGVYKGIIGDSTKTGNILIDFNNSQSVAKAYITFRGSQYILSQTDIANVNGVITITLEKDNQVIKLRVGGIGNNPTISYISLNGSVEYGSTILKEKSTNKVKCFEGKYNSNTSTCGAFVNVPLGILISGQDAQMLLYAKSQFTVGSGYYYFTTNYDINTQKIKLTALDAPVAVGYYIYINVNGDVMNNNAAGTYNFYIAKNIYGNGMLCESEGDWTTTKTL